MRRMFIIFGGLPGSGKTTIAQRLADRLGACYLRIDSIEQAVRAAQRIPDDRELGPVAYIVACGIAAENLRHGLTVIADSVNPVEASRSAYRQAAHDAGVPFLEVAVLCSDQALHRQRLEDREAQREEHKRLRWDDIRHRPFDVWTEAGLILDTATLSVEQSVDTILANAGMKRQSPHP